MAQTATELLEQKKQEVETQQNRLTLRKKKFLIATVGLVLCCVTLFTISYLVGKGDIEAKHTKYISDFTNDVSDFVKLSENQELVQFGDSYKYFERYYMGNSNNYLLMFGKDLPEGFNPKLNGNKTLNDLQLKSKNDQISYLNFHSNTFYYRLNSDKKIYELDSQGNRKIIVDVKTGESLYCKGKLYYVNFSDGSKLYYKDIENKKDVQIINESISSFGILGSKILFLTTNAELKIYDMKTKDMQVLQKNIDSFVLWGMIAVKSGDKIVCFTLDNNRPELLLSGVSALVGADDSFIYYTSGKKLNAFDIKTHKKHLLIDNVDICTTIYEKVSKFVVFTYSRNIEEKYIDNMTILSKEEVLKR